MTHPDRARSMARQKVVTFHNPLSHRDADGRKQDAVTVRFRIPTHEAGGGIDYEVAPGKEVQIQADLAYAVKIYAPQMAEGPAPSQKPRFGFDGSTGHGFDIGVPHHGRGS